jgi:N,N'-diacetyllegionaminate synthase
MTKIIAEIGWNHCGDMRLARQMIDAASASGADIVKFQTWCAKDLKPGPWDQDGRRDLYHRAELSEEDHAYLLSACKESGVQFMTSIFNRKHCDFLAALSNAYIKVPSPECRNVELLEAINGRFQTVIVSTGASLEAETARIPGLIKKSKLVLLHCVSSYPCPPESANLLRIAYLRKFTPYVGLSGHSIGIEDALFAVSQKVDYVEKHFTIDQSLPGRDNKFSILPESLKTLSKYRDMIGTMTTDCGFDYQACEADIREIYASRWCG